MSIDEYLKIQYQMQWSLIYKYDKYIHVAFTIFTNANTKDGISRISLPKVIICNHIINSDTCSLISRLVKFYLKISIHRILTSKAVLESIWFQPKRSNKER